MTDARVVLITGATGKQGVAMDPMAMRETLVEELA
jgi:hypothetical protein